jgi:serine/threonine protein kinase
VLTKNIRSRQPSLLTWLLDTRTVQTAVVLKDGRFVLHSLLLLVQAAHIFRKMVEVVNHCHELGVMHRCA